MGQAASAASAAAPPTSTALDLALDALETPALVVDLAALEHNERALSREVGLGGGRVVARPHIKSHKCAWFAQRQLREACVVGLSCATVREVELAVGAAHCRDVLLTNVVVSRARLSALARLCVAHCGEERDCSRAPGPRGTGSGSGSDSGGLRLLVCVDSDAALERLSGAAAAEGVTVGAVVDLNVGQGRCGLDTVGAAVRLARRCAELPGLRFVGLQGYHGSCQHVRAAAERRAAADAVAARLLEARDALLHEGLRCELLTGGGTGSVVQDRDAGALTELQPGSYLFMDADYLANPDARALFRPALYVLATVISRGPGRMVLDAGLKAHSIESGLPALALDEHQAARFAPHCATWTVCNGGDEHTVVRWDREPGSADQLPKVGDKLRLLVGHVDPTFNMHRHVYLYRGHRVERVAAIDSTAW
jgi:D-serine deaminase-like pyridoxal phosphate-dependent protein